MSKRKIAVFAAAVALFADLFVGGAAAYTLGPNPCGIWGPAEAVCEAAGPVNIPAGAPGNAGEAVIEAAHAVTNHFL